MIACICFPGTVSDTLKTEQKTNKQYCHFHLHINLLPHQHVALSVFYINICTNEMIHEIKK